MELTDRLGGGGTGSGRNWTYSILIGKGGNGTSYSGGTGSGASNSDGAYGGYAASGAGSNIGGTGGNGAVSSGNQSGFGQVSVGGVGNPSGTYKTYRENFLNQKVNNGTGGLLIIYSFILNNDGKILSEGTSSTTGTLSNSSGLISYGGSSGGGSINLFYKMIKNKNNGIISANGGKNMSYANWAGSSGAGGNGSISSGSILEDDYFEIKN